MTGTHPWRRFRGLAHYTLCWHDHGPLGLTDFVARTVSLRRGLDQAQRRSTIMHETLHAERGPVPMGLAAKEETYVRKQTARELLPCIVTVGDALIWAQGHVEPAADELWVDLPTLTDRLKYCTTGEREYLLRRLQQEAPPP
jgi:hypothetical protein